MILYTSVNPPYHWAKLDQHRKFVESGLAETLEDLPVTKNLNQLVGVVPSEAVITRKVTIPTRRRPKAEAAIPYALEESLSDDINTLHFSIIDWNPGLETSVAIVARADLDAWLDEFRASGYFLDALVPEYLLLPLHPQSRITLAATGDNNIVIRDGLYSGFELDQDYLEDWWESIDDKATSINVNDRELAQRLIQHEASIASEWAIGRHFPEWLRHHSQEIIQTNLLQGQYRPSHHGGYGGNLKVALIMLVAAFGLKVVADGAELFWLTNKNQQLKEETLAVFKQSFPSVTPVVEPRRQMEKQLAELNAGFSPGATSFQQLLDLVGKAMKTARGTLTEVDFRDNTLFINCTVTNFSGLDMIKKQIELNPGIAAELLSSGSLDNKVTGHFKIQSSEL